ncbi:MAG: hypothetical protein ACI837_000732 [Crocinitomicaceae bacterium]|jgi:hypothetical protein
MRVLLLLITFPCVFTNAQTDIIAFRSHSGNLSKFTGSAHSIDGLTTNFGMDPYRNVKTAALDTIRFLENGMAVMITSEYCREQNMFDDNDKVNDCSPRTAYGHLWSAGIDTMDNHPLFKRVHSLDSIKEVLKSTYNFQNSIDSVVFIGYDNAALQSRKINKQNDDSIKEGRKSADQIRKLEAEKSKKSRVGFMLLITILLPLILIYVFGPLAFRWAKNESQLT